MDLVSNDDSSIVLIMIGMLVAVVVVIVVLVALVIETPIDAVTAVHVAYTIMTELKLQ
ncbi:Hypothetical protein MVR_LOCUS127 [uncultured virus]|nr:Hypothetical protein MVR_LOCUS127 [uncultured virus]